ncbi:MAG: 16S rRNA (uracil(1498)-N(3))-methyltransferase [Candidatus Nanopelagicales bacterium]|nr:16S rRNA (uracil(1498)-N(3))-methyltransferase [Candidatus Nanopelagicales bacterium]
MIHDAGLQRVQVNDEVPLTGEEGRHAVSSLRINVGEEVELVDGHGLRVRGTVIIVSGKDTLRIQVTKIEVEGFAELRTTVVQALPKGEHGELAVDLLTQVGVDVIVPWAAARSLTRWAPDRIEKARNKWQGALTAAAKQSRRARWPVLGELATTTAVADLIAAGGTCIVLHEEAVASVLDVPIADLGGTSNLVLIVGPEGGISDEERDIFRAAGAIEACLGPGVLRSSAAGAVAVAVLSAARNWGGPVMGGSRS